MMEKIIRFFVSTVEFSAEGAETEALLNYCAKNKITILEPGKSGFTLFGKVFSRDYKKLRYPARKFGLKIRHNKKKGLRFFIKRNISRAGLLFGAGAVIPALIISRFFVWNIEVRGNNNLSEEEILIAAEEVGLRKGTLSKSHFTQDMEWYLLRKFDEIATAEINIIGSNAEIIISERLDPAKMIPDDDIPTNLIASRYGVIRKVEVFDGQSLVKPGDAVMKGDLLVSAVYEDSHKKLTLKHARADIIAETDYRITAEFPLEQKITVKGKKAGLMVKIDFLGLEIRLGKEKNADEFFFEKEEKQLCFMGIELPINLIIKRFFAVKEKDITYNFEQGKDGAFALLEKMEKEEMKNIEIISRKTAEKIKNGKYTVEADYICLMNIAEEDPIESDIPWKNTDDMS